MQAILPMQQPSFSASHGFGHAIADAAVAAANQVTFLIFISSLRQKLSLSLLRRLKWQLLCLKRDPNA
jgi:hypothetical protein